MENGRAQLWPIAPEESVIGLTLSSLAIEAIGDSSASRVNTLGIQLHGLGGMCRKPQAVQRPQPNPFD